MPVGQASQQRTRALQASDLLSAEGSGGDLPWSSFCSKQGWFKADLSLCGQILSILQVSVGPGVWGSSVRKEGTRNYGMVRRVLRWVPPKFAGKERWGRAACHKTQLATFQEVEEGLGILTPVKVKTTLLGTAWGGMQDFPNLAK